MNDVQSAKPLFWVASSQRDLRRFPEDVKQAFGFALWQAQNGAKHPDAKPLKGFGGAGVLELRQEAKGSAYRAVYTVDFAEAVYVLHAFQKKSTKGIKTAQADLELIRSRLKLAKEHYDQWRTSPEREEEE